MEKSNSSIPTSTVTRNLSDFIGDDQNLYQALRIISKRSNQLSSELKIELAKKLEEFASYTDNLEEVFENREQIEISKYYEKLPKSVLVAIEEYLEGKIYHRVPEEEQKDLV